MEDCGFGSLGFYNLALISLTSGIFCPFSTYFIKKWGVNKCLVIASITNGLFITSSALAPLKKLH
jgi:MFS family permease